VIRSNREKAQQESSKRSKLDNENENDRGELLSGLKPAECRSCWEAYLVENPVDHGINEIIHRGWLAVKRRGSRQNDRPSLQESRAVADMNQIPGSLAQDQDQFPPFLKKNIRRAMNRRIARPGGDPPKCTHGAWNNDHGVELS
jgi:hypothetical protein